MERTRLSSLLVTALLQLSQTDISSTLPESWYAANGINDGVYLPKPLSEVFATEETFSSTHPIVVQPIWSATPRSIVKSTSTERPVTNTEVSVVPLSTRPPLPPLPPQPPQLPVMPQFQQQPQPPSPPPIMYIPQGIQIQTASQGSPVFPQPFQNQPPNYFLLYQQLSQSVQNSPSTSQLPSSSLPPVTTSTTLPTTITTTTLPLNSSTPTSTTSTSTTSTSTTTTTLPPSSSTTQAPCATNTTSVPQASTQFPTFQIRMVAPSGSMTNVRISADPTATTTTTRRPTTTKTRRRNRNNYDGCVNGCGGNRVPICASPLGVSPVNPDTLKGFPSLCHMACNNSFRKNLYEKVMDGKCGKLRTRIRPIDSNDKLKRYEMNKASYTIVPGGSAVLEFSPLTI